MSVHGEYGRALEAMLDRLRSLTHPKADLWIEQLEATRVSAHPDLTAAARACLEVLAAIDRDPIAHGTEGLRDPHERLEAHSRIISGGPA